MFRRPLAAWFLWYFTGLAAYGLLIGFFYLIHLDSVIHGWVGWPVGIAAGLTICVLAQLAERRARRRIEAGER